jgi:hypothetical protein
MKSPNERQNRKKEGKQNADPPKTHQTKKQNENTECTQEKIKNVKYKEAINTRQGRREKKETTNNMGKKRRKP